MANKVSSRCLSTLLKYHFKPLTSCPSVPRARALCSLDSHENNKKIIPHHGLDSINEYLYEIWGNMKNQRGQKYTILLSSVTIFAGFMTGAYLAKYSANILNFLGLYVYSDDNDDNDND